MEIRIVLSFLIFQFIFVSGQINSFPYYQNFESTQNPWTSGGTASDWFRGTPAGPVLTTCFSGVNCWKTAQSLYNNDQDSWVQSPLFNISLLTYPVVRFYYFCDTERGWDGSSLQILNGSNWVTVGKYSNNILQSRSWYNYYLSSTDAWTGSIPGWNHAIYDLTQLSISDKGNVRFRFTFKSDGSANGEGFAFDDFWLVDGARPSCPVSFTPSNGTTSSLQSVPLQWSVVEGNTSFVFRYDLTVTKGVTVVSNVTFTSATSAPANTFSVPTVSLQQGQTYSWTIRPYGVNNLQPASACPPATFSIVAANVVTVPYFNDFETSTTGWSTDGWRWGNPTAPGVPTGSKVWAIGLNGTYGDNANTYLFSPIFNGLTGLGTPVLSFKVGYTTEAGYDGTQLQYTLDDGVTWSTLGTITSTLNSVEWYDYTRLTLLNGPAWSNGAAFNWTLASHRLPNTNRIQFRFWFVSDTSNSNGIFAIDDFFLGSGTPPPCPVIRSPSSSTLQEFLPATFVWFSNINRTNPIYSYNVSLYLGSNLVSSQFMEETVTTFISPSLSFNSSYTLNIRSISPLVSSCNFTFQTLPSVEINTLPHFQNFDGVVNGWFRGSTTGTANSWTLGAINKGVLTGPPSPPKGWITGLSTDYFPDESSYILSPTFNLTSYSGTTIVQFSLKYNTEMDYDGLQLQYSVTGGVSWTTLLTGTQTTNWYDSTRIPGWSGNSGTWKVPKYNFGTTLNGKLVIFRFLFISDYAAQSEGVAIDDFFFGTPFVTTVQQYTTGEQTTEEVTTSLQTTVGVTTQEQTTVAQTTGQTTSVTTGQTTSVTTAPMVTTAVRRTSPIVQSSSQAGLSSNIIITVAICVTLAVILLTLSIFLSIKYLFPLLQSSSNSVEMN